MVKGIPKSECRFALGLSTDPEKIRAKFGRKKSGCVIKVNVGDLVNAAYYLEWLRVGASSHGECTARFFVVAFVFLVNTIQGLLL